MSVVVITQGRRHTLDDVVRAVLADTATSEVIVVVDAPRAGATTTSVRLPLDDPRLAVVDVVDRGPSAARQAGVEAATSEVVLLLDDDVVPRAGLVTGHARWHAVERGVVVLGYMPTVARPAVPAPSFATRLYALDYEQYCSAYEREPSTILRSLWGGNVSLRRSDCASAPLHSPLFAERHHEDQDFGLRCLEAGLVGRFCRRLRADHHHRSTLEEFVAAARREGRGRVRIHELHGHVLGALEPRAFAAGLPLLPRLVVLAARHPTTGRCVARLLSGATGLCGRLGLPRGEILGARLLRRVEQQRAAIGAGCADPSVAVGSAGVAS